MAPSMPRWLHAPDLRSVLHSATRSGYLYPLKGVIHFIVTRPLHPLLTSRLLTTTLLSLFVTFTLFFWTYLPQLLFLSIFHRPFTVAAINTTFLVLSESAAITALLFEAFFVDETLVDMFDAVLVSRGYEELVRTHRPVDLDEREGEVKRLGRPTHKSVYAPFSLRQIVEFLLLLPLNLVPYVGVPAFLWLTGYRAGPLNHYRLFKFRDMNKMERNDWVKRRRAGYTGFGAVALCLQLVPVLSMVFLVTTAAGSALWAADIMDGEREQEGGEEIVRGRGGRQPAYDDYADDYDEDAGLLA